MSRFLSANVLLPSRVHEGRHAIWTLRSRVSEYLEAYICARFADTLADCHDTPDSDPEFTDAATQLILHRNSQ